MTLTTHAITGAGFAVLLPTHPVGAFALGFVSHFLLDAIPHWDYSLSSMQSDGKNKLNNDMKLGKDFLRDLAKVATDALLGVSLSVLVFGMFLHLSFLTVVCGAIGAILPDALQFVYMKWRHEPFVTLQRFHMWIHAEKHLNDRPVVGILSQVVLIVLVVFVFNLL
jgi:hypothetical protein